MDKPKILFVDDEVEVLVTYKRNFKKYFEVHTSANGLDGLMILEKKGPFSVVVSDMRMPQMNGSQFLKRVYESFPDITRILLTGESDINDTIKAINEGHIYRFLSKPCPPNVLYSSILDGIRQYKLVKSEKILLEKTLRGSIKLLVDILTITKPEEFTKIARIKKMSKEVIRELNPKLIWKMEIVAMLSHIGCVTLPPEILHKKETEEVLSREDNDIYVKHSEVGFQLLSNIPRLGEIAEAIKYQEKNIDGTGFPVDDKRNDEIPLLARIIRIVYDFDLLIVRGLTVQKALDQLEKFKGRYYDGQIVDILAEIQLNSDDSLEIVKYAMPTELEEGMVLDQDVKASNGAVLITSGHEVSEVLLHKIQKYYEAEKITGKIKVKVIAKKE